MCYPDLAGGPFRAGQRLDSEQFRSAPRISRPPYGRLMVPENRAHGLVGGADSARGRKSPMLNTKRREFIALIGGGGLLLAVKVRRARGQQAAMPVVGLLGATTPHGYAAQLRSVSPGPERSWLCRGPQRSHRISLGGRPVRSAAGVGRRSGSPSGGRDCHTRWKYGVGGSEGGDHHDSSRVSRQR